MNTENEENPQKESRDFPGEWIVLRSRQFDIGPDPYEKTEFIAQNDRHRMTTTYSYDGARKFTTWNDALYHARIANDLTGGSDWVAVEYHQLSYLTPEINLQGDDE